MSLSYPLRVWSTVTSSTLTSPKTTLRVPLNFPPLSPARLVASCSRRSFPTSTGSSFASFTHGCSVPPFLLRDPALDSADVGVLSRQSLELAAADSPRTVSSRLPRHGHVLLPAYMLLLRNVRANCPTMAS
ncbi:hypothetical protein AURDEDRAFT_178291 [Auricularia subglabra TFB-10046 SS5]|uniref:Uncharacterized protein n=1 Tax=Auricularia subglabra (strain TFB-10046 / SS5) TaxID=717982 RepID=J0WLG7_AURST|nr:hypothetical protein AURDEDRAFT_178291 [Auricularia subglabra TFB-10046 SS5]